MGWHHPGRNDFPPSCSCTSEQSKSGGRSVCKQSALHRDTVFSSTSGWYSHPMGLPHPGCVRKIFLAQLCEWDGQGGEAGLVSTAGRNSMQCLEPWSCCGPC